MQSAPVPQSPAEALPACLRCGTPFVPYNPQQRYCSKQCMWAAVAERRRRRLGMVSLATLAPRLCEDCQQEFSPKHAAQKWCSRRCKNRFESAKRYEPVRFIAEMKRCIQCHGDFMPKHPTQLYCNVDCRAEAGIERRYFGEKRHGNAGRIQTPEQVAARTAATKRTLATHPVPCRRCSQDFIRSVGSQRYCSPDCATKASRARRSPSERVRLPRQAYERLRDTQGGVCAICQGVNPTGSRLSVDHNHATGVIRGLLCSSCNRGIGYLKDDVALVAAALSYLQQHT